MRQMKGFGILFLIIMITACIGEELSDEDYVSDSDDLETSDESGSDSESEVEDIVSSGKIRLDGMIAVFEIDIMSNSNTKREQFDLPKTEYFFISPTLDVPAVVLTGPRLKQIGDLTPVNVVGRFDNGVLEINKITPLSKDIDFKLRRQYAKGKDRESIGDSDSVGHLYPFTPPGGLYKVLVVPVKFEQIRSHTEPKPIEYFRGIMTDRVSNTYEFAEKFNVRNLRDQYFTTQEVFSEGSYGKVTIDMKYTSPVTVRNLQIKEGECPSIQYLVQIHKTLNQREPGFFKQTVRVVALPTDASKIGCTGYGTAYTKKYRVQSSYNEEENSYLNTVSVISEMGSGRVLAHELGHVLGTMHAGRDSKGVGRSDSEGPYADIYCVMGRGNHFSLERRDEFGWLDADQLKKFDWMDGKPGEPVTYNSVLKAYTLTKDRIYTHDKLGIRVHVPNYTYRHPSYTTPFDLYLYVSYSGNIEDMSRTAALDFKDAQHTVLVKVLQKYGWADDPNLAADTLLIFELKVPTSKEGRAEGIQDERVCKSDDGKSSFKVKVKASFDDEMMIATNNVRVSLTLEKIPSTLGLSSEFI